MPSLRGACVALILVAAVVVTAQDGLKNGRAHDQKHKRVVKTRKNTATVHRRTSAFQSCAEVSADDMAQALIGSTDSLVVSDAVYTGSPAAAGIADLNGSGHYLEESVGRAVVLTTGDGSMSLDTVNDLKDSTTSLDTEGNNVIGANSWDAAGLQFTITPSQDGSISWQYVFASEEYPEYVGSRFNDGFRFKIDSTDVAILPNSDKKVSINNVNSKLNSEYFIDNHNGSLATEYDGLTTLLTTQAIPVSAGTQHIFQMIIADVADTDYDSAVYIKAGSLLLSS